MELLGDEYDFTYVVAGGGDLGDDPLGINVLLRNLRTQGFDRVVGRSNHYGAPKFQWALRPEDNVPNAYLVKAGAFMMELEA